MLKKILQGLFSIRNEYDLIRKVKRKVITLFFIKFKMPIKPKAIVLTMAGGIGDYIHTRPYFKYLKTSEKYKDYKLVYVEKTGCVDIALSIDKNCFDEIIEVDCYSFVTNRKYRKGVLRNININRVEELIDLRIQNLWEKYNHISDFLIKEIKPKTITGAFQGDSKLRKLNNSNFKKYNKKFINEDYLFIDEQKRWFFEQILEKKLPLETDLCIPSLYDVSKKHIAVSVMASHVMRCYPNEKWTIILNHLLDNIDSNTEILFLGQNDERYLIENLIETLNHKEKCKNIAGLISTAMLPMFLKNCEFLISVETGTVHFAHSIGLKSICICNGQTYGRFQPYQENVEYIYPKEFIEKLKTYGEKFKKDAYEVYKYDILTANIEVQDVIKAVDKLLSETKLGCNMS